MTTIWLYEDIARDEGFRGQAYPDPLSPLAAELRKPEAARCAGWAQLSGQPWTCGYGATGPDIGPTTTMTQAQAYARLMATCTSRLAELDAQLRWWRRLNDARQDVLVNLAYNLGLPRLLGFKKMLAALQLQDWTTAKAELLDSQAERQERQLAKPNERTRYERLGDQLATGARIAA